MGCSRSALSAGETPAVPVLRSPVKQTFLCEEFVDSMSFAQAGVTGILIAVSNLLAN
jgi:hypothetical protein